MGQLPEYIFEDDYGHESRYDYSYLAKNYVEGTACCTICERGFGNQCALEQHIQNHSAHHYCPTHDREFMHFNNYKAHMESKAHKPASFECPRCHKTFTSPAHVAGHLESEASCLPNGRHDLKRFIQKMDKYHYITKPAIELPGFPASPNYEATASSFNGTHYECFLCGNEYRSLHALNQHLKSAVHEQAFYRCPGPECGREFKVLQGLMLHVEMGNCGVSRFKRTQDAMATIAGSFGNLRIRV